MNYEIWLFTASIGLSRRNDDDWTAWLVMTGIKPVTKVESSIAMWFVF
jgi:hypothetical protein